MADEDIDPVVQRLICGELARQWRTRRGIELADADVRLGKYRGKLSKIETGLLAPRVDETETLIEMYELRGLDADEFRSLAAAARRRSPSEPVESAALRYIVLERSATEIRMAYPEIPGLLQTRDYAIAALSRSTSISAAELPKLADARAERGQRLTGPNGPKIYAIIGESALYYEVGGRDVLRRQIEHLRAIADLSNVSIRIFEFVSGSIPALSCPFTLLHSGTTNRTFAYVETITKVDYPKTTRPYAESFDYSWKLAAPDDTTRAILEARISNLT